MMTNQPEVVLGVTGSIGAYKAADLVRQLRDAGYAVLTLDQRGHGESGGQIEALNPEKEGADMSQALDWVEENAEWIRYEYSDITGNDNLVLGTYGSSYGGGFQHTILSWDTKQRLDAMVPDITWHHLTYSFAPNLVLKTAWVTLLEAGGNAAGSGGNNADLGRAALGIEDGPAAADCASNPSAESGEWATLPPRARESAPDQDRGPGPSNLPSPAPAPARAPAEAPAEAPAPAALSGRDGVRLWRRRGLRVDAWRCGKVPVASSARSCFTESPPNRMLSSSCTVDASPMAESHHRVNSRPSGSRTSHAMAATTCTRLALYVTTSLLFGVDVTALACADTAAPLPVTARESAPPPRLSPPPVALRREGVSGMGGSTATDPARVVRVAVVARFGGVTCPAAPAAAAASEPAPAPTPALALEPAPAAGVRVLPDAS